MGPSAIDYDVYNTPRIGPIQFGDYVAGDGTERANILRNAKYFRRTHLTRAWYAKEEIVSYLTSPKKSLGQLDAAVELAKTEAANAAHSNEKLEDAAASVDCLKKFIAMSNMLDLTGKLIDALPEDQAPVKIGGLSIRLDFACLLRSADKDGNDRVGAIFLNTQKGKGLGQREDTKKKREKAGESVAILVFKRLMDEFSDDGMPMQSDSVHLYVRAEHFWRAPNNYSSKLKNLTAEAQMISQAWPNIEPPADFKEEKAKFHD